MATSARSIASLTLSFGLVNVPVRLYSATESGADVRFHLLDKDGSRLKQQYVNERTRKVVERKDMMKGYEVEKDHFVLFAPEELKNLEEGSSHVIEIVSFVPLSSIDPLFYDKSYLLAPDKRGAKPYALLAEAMRQSDRCALAKWAFKAKQYIVQVRANDDGLILQQLRYADEVRSWPTWTLKPPRSPAPNSSLPCNWWTRSPPTPSTRRNSRTKKRPVCSPPSMRRSRASRSWRPPTARTNPPAGRSST